MNQGPAVVLSLFDNVHLVAATGAIESARTVLRLKHEISAGLPVESLGIAMTVRPDFWTHILLSDKGVVSGNGTIVIQSECLTRQRIQFLGEIALSGIAGRDVELSVWPETQTAASMKLGGRDVLDYYFTFNKTSRRFSVTHHSHSFSVTCVGIGKINKVIGGKLRMKRNAHQSAFARRLDIWNREDGLRP